MKVKRVFLFVFASILILGLASGAAAAVNPPLGQDPAPGSPGATGSRSGIPDTTPPLVYVSPASFSEGFDDITILPDWYMQNNSDPLGLTDWFQGNDTVFPAQAGAPTAYIAANFNNTSGAGTISNWLLTPEQALNNGATLSFWTRTATDSVFPDRLQVRLSTDGPSTDVGTGAEDVGVFTTLLLEVNPNLDVGGYPEVWTQYILTLSGIPDGTSGRLAFRYYVTNGGPSGDNSNYIGIDTVEFIDPPPSIALSKTVGTAPGICATTDSITVTVGTTVYYCYEVTNTGVITLTLHDLVDDQLGTIFTGFNYALTPGSSVNTVEAGLSIPSVINATTVNTATWTAHANTPIAFYDISSSGTPLDLADDGEANVVIPFPFTYFGATSTDLRVGNNGGLLFGVTTGDLPVSNTSLPDAGLSAPAILPFWDDLDSDTGNVYYATMGAAPNRMFIVEWYNRPHYSNTGSATLEVILYEGSNTVDFRYLDTDFGNASYDFGASATSGLQESTLSAVQYSYNQPALYNEFGLRLSPPDYLPQPLDGAVATATATVNVVIPEIDVDPASLVSRQVPDSAVSKTLTISNLGDPLTSLDWMVLESQPVAKSPGSSTAGPEQSGAQKTGSAAEVVGAAVPKGVGSTPSAIGQHSRPYVPTDVLYDNGPLVTHPGGGAGGADASAVQSALGMNTYGFGHQVSAGNRVADDFTITDEGGWQIDTITFYAYQTGSGNTSTITAVNLQIWDGVPGDPGSNIVWGDTTTNVLVNTAWSNIYRVLDTALTNADRPVMADTVAVDTHLGPGTYWLDWQSDGSPSYSGPWAPPVTILGETTTGNARQFTTGAWADLVDTGSSTPQGLPFIIEGSQGGCVGDIPWATVEPVSGTLSGGDSTPVEVIFDSTGLANGVYTGTLCVISNDPDEGLTSVPLTMTVTDPTYLEVGHLAPFAADPGTAVTVTLNGEPALTDFVYGESIGYLTLPEGTYDVAVWPAGSTTPAITGTVSLMPDTYYTAIAIGDGVNQDLDLKVLTDDLTAPAAGQFHLRLGHLAPFASGDALADIRLQDGTPVITDVAFSDVTAFMPMAAGEYDLKVTTPGGAITLIDPLPVTFSEGDIVSAFATGDGSNQPLGAFAWPAGVEGFFLPLAISGVELSPAAAAQSGAPGETVVYSLMVTNTGNITDTFGITVTAGWDVHLPVAELTLGAGASTEFVVHVDIPADAADGDSDVATVTVIVEGVPSATAESELTTTAVISERKIYLPLVMNGYNAP